MATLLIGQSPGLAGAELTFSAADNAGNYFTNTGREVLVCKNANDASRTLTLDSPNTCDFGITGSGHDVAITVTGNATTPKITAIGPFNPGKFNDANNQVQMTFTSVIGLTVALVKQTL